MGTVEGDVHGRRIRITTAPATVLAGMRRARLQEAGRRAAEDDPDRLILRVIVYPDLLAGSAQIEVGPPDGELAPAAAGWPDFETFLDFPDGLAGAWERAVYDDNPHWLPEAAVEDPKAPALASTPVSGNGRKRGTQARRTSPT